MRLAQKARYPPGKNEDSAKLSPARYQLAWRCPAQYKTLS